MSYRLIKKCSLSSSQAYLFDLVLCWMNSKYVIFCFENLNYLGMQSVTKQIFPEMKKLINWRTRSMSLLVSKLLANLSMKMVYFNVLLSYLPFCTFTSFVSTLLCPFTIDYWNLEKKNLSFINFLIKIFLIKMLKMFKKKRFYNILIRLYFYFTYYRLILPLKNMGIWLFFIFLNN